MELPDTRHLPLARTYVELNCLRCQKSPARAPEVLWRQGAHGPLGADGHERRRIDGAVRQGERAGSRGAAGRVDRELMHPAALCALAPRSGGSAATGPAAADRTAAPPR